MRPHVRDGFSNWYAVQHSQARECGAGATDAAAAGDFDAYAVASEPGVPQRLTGVGAIDGQPEVRPSKPSALPGGCVWPTTEQVEPEVGQRPRWERPAQPTAPDQPARRQPQYALSAGIPGVRHRPSVAG